MKYKKYRQHLATGALAISLLVGGSSARSDSVGIVGAISSSGFTLEMKNLKTKTTSSIDVQTDAETAYSKNGLIVPVSDLALGQKAIVVGNLDKTANILIAQTVKIVK